MLNSSPGGEKIEMNSFRSPKAQNTLLCSGCIPPGPVSMEVMSEALMVHDERMEI